ncbi:PaaI family thioesterase [Mesobacillus maritimus]|uniref:PaaI family thioesterase n=1 Tax=Mesobacillus maritimus TaxID=1643336 RepID=UPI00203A9BAB|nr:PaaI family thioesterase [Mesobacillus maritimus]MCM3668458.1 PaaI family thioesterase [Mesobacillus maritimus]
MVTAVEKPQISWLEKNLFIKHLGFEPVVEERENVIAVKLFIDSNHLNIQQNLHGGVHASMLDTIHTVVLRNVYQTSVSVQNLNVHYLAGTSTGEIIARAKIIQQGYKIAAVDSEIVDEHGTLIAKGSGVYKIKR